MVAAVERGTVGVVVGFGLTAGVGNQAATSSKSC
jgi:hypothetical protein